MQLSSPSPNNGGIAIRQSGPPALISYTVWGVLLSGLVAYLGLNIVFDEDPFPVLTDGIGGLMFLLLLSMMFFRKAVSLHEVKPLLIAACAYLLLLAASTFANGNPYVSKPQALLLDMFIEGKIFFVAFALLLALRYFELQKFFKVVLWIFLGMGLLNLLFVLQDMALGATIHGRRLPSFLGFSVPLGLFNQKTKSAQIQLFAFIACMAFLRDPRSGMKLFWQLMAGGMLASVLVHLSVKETVAAFAVIVLNYAVHPNRTLGVGAAVALPLMLLASAALIIDNPIKSSAMNRIQIFFGEAGAQTVRTASYSISTDLAAQKFPLGTGASTFMSKGARDLAYSPVYIQTGMSKLHGGSRADPKFLMDTFWPKVLGQTGIFGLIAFGLLVMTPTVLSVIRLKYTVSRDAFAAAGILVAMATASLAAPVYTDDHLIFLTAAALALTLSHRVMANRQKAILCTSTSWAPAAYQRRMADSRPSLQI